jgi:glycosyltransferase involved in cell wall biosynthesis
MEVRMVGEAKALRELGYDLIVAAPLFPGSHKFTEALHALGVSFTPFAPAPIFTNWRWRGVAWLYAELWQRHVFARFQVDLIHVFFSWTDQGLDPLWLASRCGRPAVISVHNAFPKTEFLGWYQRHLEEAFRTVQGVYGVSQSALDHFADNFATYFPADMTSRVIYNFVDTGRFKPSDRLRAEVRRQLSIPKDATVLGSVGRFDDQKKSLSLVGVFARVRKKIPDARLLLIGEGALEAQVRTRIRELGCEDAVTIVGFQPDVERYFAAMDLHLLLSRNEGFGIVTAEAMACGVLAIGTKVPGTTEVIGNCPAGRLVALGDEEEAACSAVELLQMPQEKRVELAGLARRHVESRFSKTRWHEDIATFYSTALSGSQLACA